MAFDFNNFLEEKRTWYNNVDKVFCPILNQWVIFNSKGFRHLRYDEHGKARLTREQIYKLRLLPLVIPVIKNATTVFDYKKQEYSKPLGKYFEIWQLKEIMGKKKPTIVSVILRRIGDGHITFLSVYDEKIKTKKPSR